MKMTHSLRGRLLWFLLAAITIAAVAQATIASAASAVGSNRPIV